MEIIKRISECKNITKANKELAIADIEKMIENREYAEKVDFNKDSLHLPKLFKYHKSELGQNFWHDLYIRLIHDKK